MTLARRAFKNSPIGPEALNLDYFKHRYCFENFMQEPSVHVKGSLTEPGGTSLTEQVIFTGLNQFEYYFLGTVTDLLIPTLASDGGYNWGGASSDVGTGFEINFGGLKNGHPRNFIPDSEDWFARLLVGFDDVSGADFTFGFRKVAAAPVATLTEVVDLVGIRVLGDDSSALGAITIVTNQNNDGTTDFTSTALTNQLTDAQSMEFEVQSIGGVSRYLINGVPVGTSAAFTFDAGDSFSPVARIIQTTDIHAQAKTFAYEAGPISCRRDATLQSLAGDTV